MKSPFKFLDAFTLADKDVFFGREEEVKNLYELVYKTRLVLLYGLSGTGKTSVIQCGLAARFDGTDWYPFTIRRQDNINVSLAQTIQNALPEAVDGSLADKLRYIFRYYISPIYLIFDQFEELFILGDKKEQTEFAETLNSLIKSDFPCTVILVIREEYLGQLYNFEKQMPTLFDHRLRIESMSANRVQNVLKNSFSQFNIRVESPEPQTFEHIIEKITGGKSGIQLPYLQVYLDGLYHDDFQRTYQRDRIDNELPDLELTRDEITKFGKIDDVLERYLAEQIVQLQEGIKARFPTAADDTATKVLDNFVSEEGTKRPLPTRPTADGSVVDIAGVSDKLMSFCLNTLEKARLIRFMDTGVELAHDSLAAVIDKKRTNEQRQLNEIRRQIRISYTNFDRTKEYLTPKQIAVFEDFLPSLDLDKEIRQFFANSKHERQREAAEELKSETEKRKRAQRFAALAIVGLLLALGAMFWAFRKQKEAEVAKIEVQKTLDNLKKEQLRREKEEFKEIYRRALTQSEQGCLSDDVRKAIDLMLQKQSKDAEFKAQIEKLNVPLKNRNCPTIKIN